mmetsp:Transcript_21226/g.48993  ORF Transcript_21226/g.48993 Transcript_21226/m.48993 type:complete len:297 (+) Transcript_21226:98-988(+)
MAHIAMGEWCTPPQECFKGMAHSQSSTGPARLHAPLCAADRATALPGSLGLVGRCLFERDRARIVARESAGNDVVDARHADPLRRRGRPQLERCCRRPCSERIHARRDDGLADGEKDGGCQEERRLADRLGRVHRERIVGVVEQCDTHVDGRVVERRDFVSTRTLGEEVPGPDPRVLPVAERKLLGRQPAKTLDKCTFDLPDVNGRVDGVSDVHYDVGPEDSRVAGETIDLDLANGCPLGEIVEGCSPHIRVATLRHRDRPVVATPVGRERVEAVGSQVHAGEEGRLYHRGEVRAW